MRSVQTKSLRRVLPEDSKHPLEPLEHALAGTVPEIFNTDQGAQFTSLEFTSRLPEKGVRISVDGRGRALDNAFVERLWRSVKWEEVYVKSYNRSEMPGTVCSATLSTTVTSDHTRLSGIGPQQRSIASNTSFVLVMVMWEGVKTHEWRIEPVALTTAAMHLEGAGRRGHDVNCPALPTAPKEDA